MATVQLSDIIDVKVFKDLPAVNTPEKTVFYDSGIVTRTAELDECANAPGKTVEMPFWHDLDNDEPNYSTDNPEQHATPAKVNQGSQLARKTHVNKGWQAANLVNELAMGADPITHIKNRTDAWWTRAWERRLLATSVGLYLNNVAANDGDMVHDISVETASTNPANLFNSNAYVDATFTLGDAFEGLGMVAMHHVVYKQAVKNNDIVYIADSNQQLTVPTYMGHRVIVTDQMPRFAGTTSGFKYLSVLFGAGCFGYGVGSPTKPVEMDSSPSAGNGAGVETLWTRNTWLLHPAGYKFNSATVSGQSATEAELKLTANWTRVLERKHIPMSFLVTNG